MKKKYSITDFSRGEEVYHLTDPKQKMIVIATNENTSEVVCRWKKDGNDIKGTYFIEELAKFSDKPAPISIIGIDRTKYHY